MTELDALGRLPIQRVFERRRPVQVIPSLSRSLGEELAIAIMFILVGSPPRAPKP